ncbi:Signal transduction histidine kinase [Nonomuraea solani]|uniref:histidine kinase n=1 Tax=Nonomuraea solani TaxID=1144553 RepID=A0A1H5ZYQ3_9ACTN|nr:ATP-binding protein [Nonomuraea solani]SEG40827.1 Signal transduction histidine kinase [Nonomuraea solani]
MWRWGLRGKMAASYVLVTATAVLLVEAVIAGFYLLPQAYATDLAAVLSEQAGNDTKVLNLALARISTAAPGQTPRELLESATAATEGRTVAGGARPRREPGLAMLAATVDTAGVVVASSAPAIYPVGGTLDVPLPGRDGMPDRPPPGRDGALDVPLPERAREAGTRTGRATWHFSPVLVKAPDQASGFDVIGYVYLQVPAGTVITPAPWPMLVPAALVLALVVPVGLVFGLLSTRRLTSRVRRLAGVTTAVAAGDFRPRIPVTGADEVSTLEQSVNAMADRLGAAVAAATATAHAEARQAERGRIARELHDSISQDLFSLSLLASGMRRAAPDSVQEQAESMERTAARAMREMQALLLELRPVALEDAGLLPALDELCHAYEERLGIAVEAVLAEVALPPQAEHAVLRLVQEALGNAVKHANPTRIEVRLSARDGVVTVSVCDDGTGFDPAGPATRHGMGLKLMRERVTELGGGLEVRSGEGGTTVTATVRPA